MGSDPTFTERLPSRRQCEYHKEAPSIAKLRVRLTRELDATADLEDRGALKVAIKSLMSAFEIQENVHKV
jgi:hypothetical protein